jgi:hypothetical protein
MSTTNCLTNQKYFICGVFVVYNFERVVLGKNITLYGKNNTLSEKKISTVRTVSSEIPGRTGGPVSCGARPASVLRSSAGTEWSMVFPGTASIRVPLAQSAG